MRHRMGRGWSRPMRILSLPPAPAPSRRCGPWGLSNRKCRGSVQFLIPDRDSCTHSDILIYRHACGGFWLSCRFVEESVMYLSWFSAVPVRCSTCCRVPLVPGVTTASVFSDSFAYRGAGAKGPAVRRARRTVANPLPEGVGAIPASRPTPFEASRNCNPSRLHRPRSGYTGAKAHAMVTPRLCPGSSPPH